MSTITIPKKIAGKDDLVVIPKREYEKLLSLKKITEFIPTKAQKQALMKAERNLSTRKTLSYHELTAKLGFADRP